GAAGRHMDQAPMPAATRTARERMSFFIYLIGMTSTPPTSPPVPVSVGPAWAGDEPPDGCGVRAPAGPDSRTASSRLMIWNSLTTLATPPTWDAAVAA